MRAKRLKKWRNCIKFLSIWLCSLCVVPTIWSHNPPTHLTLGIKEGLTQSSVNVIFKDSDGIIWIGTQDGLNYFTGEQFKSFKHDPEDPYSISDNFIVSIVEGPDKNLWIGTRHGLNILNKRKLIFQHFSNTKTDSITHLVGFTNLAFIDDNFIVSAALGGYWMHPKSGNSGKIYPNDTVQRNFILTPTGDGGYVGVYRRCIFELRNGKIIPIIRTSYKTSSIKVLFKDGANSYYMGGSFGLVHIQNHKEYPISLRSSLREDYDVVNSIRRFSDQSIWVGSNKGVFRQSPGDTTFKKLEGIFASTENVEILNMVEDNSGRIWLGTVDAGIIIINPRESQFQFVQNASDSKPILRDNTVWAFHEKSPQEIWVGTANGVSHLAFSQPPHIIAQNPYSHYHVHPIEHPELTPLHNKRINAITPFNGGLIFNSYRTGFYVLHQGSLSQYTLPSPTTSRVDSLLYHTLIASPTEVIFNTTYGLMVWNPQTKEFKRLPLARPQQNPTNYVLRLIKDKRNYFWAGTADGLIELSPELTRVSVFRDKPNNTESLSYNVITALLEDHSGRIWVGTMGAGLNVYHPVSKTFTRFNEAHGLNNATIYALLEDKKGRIWMSTNLGISCFVPEKKRFYNFISGQMEFNLNAQLATSDGIFFFGGSNGLVFFDPLKIAVNDPPTSLIIADLRFNYAAYNFRDHPFVHGNIFKPDSLTLLPGFRSVSFNLSPPEGIKTDNLELSYRINGVDADWIVMPQNEKLVNYNNLPFGTYIFEARHRFKGGTWSSPSLQFVIEVVPPFYYRRGFLAGLIAFLTLLLIAAIRRISTRKLRKKLQEARIQAGIQQERERISRELHDSVGSQLTYIIAALDRMHFRLGQQNQQHEQLKIADLQSFSRKTLQNLRDTIWTLQKEFITLEEFERKVCDYVYGYFKDTGVKVHCHLEGSPTTTIDRNTYIQLYRVIQEFTQNTLKHAHAKHVFLSLQLKDVNQFSLEIKDDGVGFDLMDHPQGNGLNNISFRVKNLHAEYQIITAPAQGTILKIFKHQSHD